MIAVYAARCLANGKCYFGITSRNLAQRVLEHLRAAENPKLRFHRALRKYGVDSFTWYEVAYTESWDDACELEIALIRLFQAQTQGYNDTLGGEGRHGWIVPDSFRAKFRGRQHTDATKAKMRAAHLGQISWCKGKTLSPEQLEARRGNKNHLGKTHTAASKELMRQAGLRNAEASRARMLGKRYTAKPDDLVQRVLADVPLLGVCAAARKHGVHRSTVRLWLKRIG